MHFKCHYKTDTLSLIISTVGTLKALRLELLFPTFHIKIVVNEIIQTNCKMRDFLAVNKCNSKKLLQLFFTDRVSKHHMFINYGLTQSNLIERPPRTKPE